MNAVKQEVPSWIKRDPETRIKEAQKIQEHKSTIIKELRKIGIIEAQKIDEEEGSKVVIEDIERLKNDLDSDDDEDDEDDEEGYIFY